MSVVIDFIGACFIGTLAIGAVWLCLGLIAPGLLIPGNSTSKTRITYWCNTESFSGKRYDHGPQHPHRTVEEATACCTAAYQRDKEAAERVPRPRPCPKCNRNHFLDECPGYRVTDSRTGEVVGYWKP